MDGKNLFFCARKSYLQNLDVDNMLPVQGAKEHINLEICEIVGLICTILHAFFYDLLMLRVGVGNDSYLLPHQTSAL